MKGLEVMVEGRGEERDMEDTVRLEVLDVGLDEVREERDEEVARSLERDLLSVCEKVRYGEETAGFKGETTGVDGISVDASVDASVDGENGKRECCD
jgi:hypothetical protein